MFVRSLTLSAVNDWAFNLSAKLSIHCVFLDFAKAFDSVPHQRLLLKLRLMVLMVPCLNGFLHFSLPGGSKLS